MVTETEDECGSGFPAAIPAGKLSFGLTGKTTRSDAKTAPNAAGRKRTPAYPIPKVDPFTQAEVIEQVTLLVDLID
jgi:hypothetical protein